MQSGSNVECKVDLASVLKVNKKWGIPIAFI